MQRRDFLQASLQTSAAASIAACGLATSSSPAHAAAPATAERELYEWRTYRLKDKAQQPAVHDYLKSAALPAWKKIGLGPVGVFTEIGAEAGPSIHVLLVYANPAAFAAAREALEADAEYVKATAEYRTAKRESPAYDRIDSSLMLAFTAAPKITPPAQKPRVLELRTYENHNDDRAHAKVAMFNDGECDIFPKCGFENVFFGETLVGENLPNLKYMLAAPDMAANEKGWKAFLESPDFIRMRDDPKYADTMPTITKLFLAPTDYSQV
jgi:hypothetical protein